MTSAATKLILCNCCGENYHWSRGERSSIEKDYHVDLCPECIEYSMTSYASYKEVINICMTGGK